MFVCLKTSFTCGKACFKILCGNSGLTELQRDLTGCLAEAMLKQIKKVEVLRDNLLKATLKNDDDCNADYLKNACHLSQLAISQKPERFFKFPLLAISLFYNGIFLKVSMNIY